MRVVWVSDMWVSDMYEQCVSVVVCTNECVDYIHMYVMDFFSLL